MPPAIPDDIRAKAIEMYQAGHTAPQCADALGISCASVYNWLDDAGIERRSNRIPPDTRRRIVALYAEFVTLDECARMFRVSRPSVERILDEAGVERRPSQHPRSRHQRKQAQAALAAAWVARS